MKKKLVLFDFDGTITTKDTLLEFIKFCHGKSMLLAGFALNSPWVVLMQLKIIPNWKAKEKILKWFFRGKDISGFNALSQQFCREALPPLIRPEALSAIKKLKTDGATVVVISASAENWVEPWCRENELHCIATRLQVIDNKLTGRIDGLNCYGPEKAKRIRACYNIDDFDEIIAYGDSPGDLEMLAMANQQFYKPFR